ARSEGGRSDDGPRAGTGSPEGRAGCERGRRRAADRERGDHRAPRPDSRAVARRIALPGVHLRTGGDVGGGRGGVAGGPREPRVSARSGRLTYGALAPAA